MDAKTALAPDGIPGTEENRIAALEQLRLLDRPDDPRFDRLTELARDLFAMPVAAISLVDTDRQWFMARCGIDMQEGPRNVAFCAHAIRHEGIFIVNDARRDPKFAANPLVTGEPGIRFYAGAVLHAPGGQRIGSLCLIDYVPRDFDTEQQRQLRSLADAVESEIASRAQEEGAITERPQPSRYDAETGLPLRTKLRHRLANLLEARDSPGATVLHLRFEGAERLYESLGHEGAHLLLARIAARVGHALPQQAMLGRWDDAEFAAVVPVDVANCDVESLVQAIANTFERPFRVDGVEHRIGVLMGVGQASADGEQADALLLRTRAAARGDTGERRGAVVWNSANDRSTLARAFDLGLRLRAAILEERIQIHLQPRVELASGRVVGAEVLARWHEPDLGWVSPAEFVPLAEQSGCIIDLGNCVLRATLRLLQRWLDEGIEPVPLAVNVSSAELRDPEFPARVRAMLEEVPIPSKWLELEVTESSLIEDIDHAIDHMQALRQLGIRFAIDDFGTGYSSFRYLRELPLDMLKVDRMFVQDIVGNEHDATIVQAIVAMARALDLQVVAEGIETEDQLLFLRAYRCDQVQGFLFSKPVAADALLPMLDPEYRFDVRVRRST